MVARAAGSGRRPNILGLGDRFDAVPFFWSQHYSVAINYSGHAERWDRIDVDGDVSAKDCTLRYLRGEQVLAVVTVGRDKASLEAERKMEHVGGG